MLQFIWGQECQADIPHNHFQCGAVYIVAFLLFAVLSQWHGALCCMKPIGIAIGSASLFVCLFAKQGDMQPRKWFHYLNRVYANLSAARWLMADGSIKLLSHYSHSARSLNSVCVCVMCGVPQSLTWKRERAQREVAPLKRDWSWGGFDCNFARKPLLRGHQDAAETSASETEQEIIVSTRNIVLCKNFKSWTGFYLADVLIYQRAVFWLNFFMEK